MLVFERLPSSDEEGRGCLFLRDKPSINAGIFCLSINSCLTAFGFHKGVFLAIALE